MNAESLGKYAKFYDAPSAITGWRGGFCVLQAALNGPKLIGKRRACWASIMSDKLPLSDILSQRLKWLCFRRDGQDAAGG